MIAHEMIERLLWISTKHLSPRTEAWLKECAEKNRAATAMNKSSLAGEIGNMGPTLYGYFMYAPSEDEGGEMGTPHDMPPELADICMEARRAHCNYILFDADAGEIDGLPIWENGVKVGTDGEDAMMDDLDEHIRSLEDGGLADELEDAIHPEDGRPINEVALPPLDIAYGGKIEEFLKANVDYVVIQGYPILSIAGITKLLERENVDPALIGVIKTRLLNDTKARWSMRRRMQSGLNFTEAGDRPFDKAGHAVIGRNDLAALRKAGADLIAFMRDAVPVHIYDKDNGDVVPDNDPHMAAAKALEEALAKIANA